MSISGMLMVGAPSSVAASRGVAPPPSLWIGGWKQRAATLGGRGTAAEVECSSRPNKKATSHHMKTRPKKTQPWDVRRKGPTAYPPLPKLPPDWTLTSSQEPAQEQQQLLQGVAAAPAAS